MHRLDANYYLATPNSAVRSGLWNYLWQLGSKHEHLLAGALGL